MSVAESTARLRRLLGEYAALADMIMMELDDFVVGKTSADLQSPSYSVLTIIIQTGTHSFTSSSLLPAEA